MLRGQVERLSDIFQYHLETNETVELRTAFIAFTSDTVALHFLGQSLGLQDDRQHANEWNRAIRAVAKYTPLIKQFTWLIHAAESLPRGLVGAVFSDLSKILHLRRVSRLELFSQTYHKQIPYLVTTFRLSVVGKTNTMSFRHRRCVFEPASF